MAAGSVVESVANGGALAAVLEEPLTPTDLAELIGAFNDVTAKLQVSHEQLTGEVARLREQLREADEQLQRSRRLAALGEMAAGIAHEIRNPLGSIGLYARMLAEDLGDRPGEREVAVKIGRAVRGLDAIVTDVLTFAGGSPVRFSLACACELAESALEQAGVGASPAGVVAVFEGPEQGLWVECDEGKLRQALINVIRNGVEAVEEAVRLGSRARRTLAVSVRREQLEGTDAVAFGVRDSGTGLPSEVLERMFNPFFTTREAGTGLGLAIVHRIVDAHGGRVRVQSNGERLGDGATVEIVIPSRRTDPRGSERQHVEAHG